MSETQKSPYVEHDAVKTAEVQALPELDVEDFSAQADYISMAIASEHDNVSGKAKAHKEYVENEENPVLQKFGKLMLLAPRAAQEQHTLNDIAARETSLKQKGQSLSDADIAARHAAVRTECAYNQMLGAMVTENEDAMPRAELVKWLSRASGNESVWAATTVSGIAGEIAAGKLLAEVPGVGGLQHADLDQDLAGQDFTFNRTSMGITGIDVKTGRMRPKLPVTHAAINHETLLLSINPEHLDKTGYAVAEKYVPGYVDELILKL